LSAKLVITESPEAGLTVTIEADPPIPLLPDGTIDPDMASLEHLAVMSCAEHLALLSGNAQWRYLLKK
jgi:hypothetical protein